MESSGERIRKTLAEKLLEIKNQSNVVQDLRSSSITDVIEAVKMMYSSEESLIQQNLSSEESSIKQYITIPIDKSGLDEAIDALNSLQLESESLELDLWRNSLLDRLVRRLFYIPSDVVAGLFDYGPMGWQLKSNVLDIWRQHFIQEENMSVVECPYATPEVVLKTSGGIQTFTDLIVKDEKTGTCYRADHLLKDFCKEKLEKDISLPTEKVQELKHDLAMLDGFSHEQIVSKIRGYGIVALDMKNPLYRADQLLKDFCKEKLEKDISLPTEKVQELKHNLAMLDGFSPEQIGSKIRGYGIVAPDTKNPLSDPQPFNLMFQTSNGPSGIIPGYMRDEAAPGIFANFGDLYHQNGSQFPFAAAQIRQDFINEISPHQGLLCESTLAEIEHFVDPEDKSHPKYSTKIEYLQFLMFPMVEQMMGKDAVKLWLGDAVTDGIVSNKTLGYFIGRVYLFLTSLGISKERLRFRQHFANDSTLNSNKRKKLSSSSDVSHDHYAADCWDAEIECSYGWIKCVSIADSAYDLDAHSEKSGNPLAVHVIESSFGIGRIIYCLFEHSFYTRPSKYIRPSEAVDEQLIVFSFPPVVAPIKCTVFPLVQNPECEAVVKQISESLTAAGISHRIDIAGSSIEKLYVRTDELGVPFAITVHPTAVTIRERDSQDQIRVEVEKVASVVQGVTDGVRTWAEIKRQYLPHSSMSTAGMAGLPSIMMNLLRDRVAEDLRFDGRERLTYRPISVQTGVLGKHLGSARVRIGGTEVYATVIAADGTPDRLRPGQGTVFIDVELSPVAAEVEFQGIGGDYLAKELARALKTGFGSAINTSSLIIEEGRRCMDLYLHGLITSADGNLLDALGAAMTAALRNAVLPKFTAENVGLEEEATDDEENVGLEEDEYPDIVLFDTVALPVIVTMTKVGPYYIADASSEEESFMCPAVSFFISRTGNYLNSVEWGDRKVLAGLHRDMSRDAIPVAKALISDLDLKITEAEVSDTADEQFWESLGKFFPEIMHGNALSH